MKKFWTIVAVLLLLAATTTACAQTELPTEMGTDESVPVEMTTEAVFELNLDGVAYSKDAQEIRLSSMPEEALEKLPEMAELKQVVVVEGGEGENLEQLRQYCDEKGVAFRIELANQVLTNADTELTFPNATDNQLRLLMVMPKLQHLHLSEPEVSAQVLQELIRKLPDTEITWEKTILGKSFDPAATVIDLTDVIGLAEGQKMGDKTAYEIGLKYRTMGTQEPEPKTAKIQYANPLPDKREQTQQLIEEVEAAMACFPEAETVLMSGAWLDNEAMAQFRERNRDNYKVAWSVQCGDMAVRTDATFFMPTKFHVKEYALLDEHVYNLRYCEDMICVDIGHMKITDLEFAAFMPELKYLVISITNIYDISPLKNCKKLVFLEMAWSMVTDYSPLLNCTALEDLNISESYGEMDDILKMTWLKNLWMVNMKESNYEKAVATLTDTNIGYFYDHPVHGAWRRLPNYYAMRDALYMFYMG